jgi:hypothetical protein
MVLCVTNGTGSCKLEMNPVLQFRFGLFGP